MTKPVYIHAAKRSAVAPRNGALSGLPLHELAAPIVKSALVDAPNCQVEALICGNGLYGGGNPARVIALASDLGDALPAITLDTQCCAGLDAIGWAASCLRSGTYETVLSGGAESYSRSPIRHHRPLDKEAEPVAYLRPPFTPWTDRDPDMTEAAAQLAADAKISRSSQEAFAIASHADARHTELSTWKAEIVEINGAVQDTFTRKLTERTCHRAPVLAGDVPYEITTATTAVEADGAAFLIMSTVLPRSRPAVRIVDALSTGGDPTRPGLAPIEAAKTVLTRHGWQAADLDRIEIMEAYAAQAQAFIDALQLNSDLTNVGGGALARGHPIGASGAILAVRLFHELRTIGSGAKGLAAIAGAGGLASVLLLEVD